MENGCIVFQADGVSVFSTACATRELSWRQVIQATVRPTLVVVSPPVGDDAPSFEQVLEPADAQAFLAQLTVKALHVAVLRRLAGLRVNQVDLAFQVPGQAVTARQLWPVVATN